MFYLRENIFGGSVWFQNDDNTFQVVRLLYHLVKFGYYLDSEDVENLLPPLLQLLDGRKDYPYPKDKDKGTDYKTFAIIMKSFKT